MLIFRAKVTTRGARLARGRWPGTPTCTRDENASDLGHSARLRLQRSLSCRSGNVGHVRSDKAWGGVKPDWVSLLLGEFVGCPESFRVAIW